jgi:hypothetical protein
MRHVGSARLAGYAGVDAACTLGRRRRGLWSARAAGYFPGVPEHEALHPLVPMREVRYLSAVRR